MKELINRLEKLEAATVPLDPKGGCVCPDVSRNAVVVFPAGISEAEQDVKLAAARDPAHCGRCGRHIPKAKTFIVIIEGVEGLNRPGFADATHSTFNINTRKHSETE